jgi:GT2 family glycosyltransferase
MPKTPVTPPPISDAPASDMPVATPPLSDPRVTNQPAETPPVPTAPVTIVTVTYNSAAVLPQMLASLPADVPVVLVDNASPDVQQVREMAAQHGAQLVETPENEGFGRACNRGAALAQTEFVLFLNPDAALHPAALDALVQAGADHPEASAFNPRLLDRHGKQVFRRRSKLAPHTVFSGPVPQEDAQIPTLMGSAIFVRRALFEQIGGFDPAIFLYHEDDDLALRLSRLGPLFYCHDAVVTHLEGRASARTPAAAGFKAFHMARSRVYTYTKHGHARARWTTLRMAALRLLLPEMLFSARKRAKHIGFFKGARSAFKDGGRYGKQARHMDT